jgi:hypothetical protein
MMVAQGKISQRSSEWDDLNAALRPMIDHVVRECLPSAVRAGNFWQCDSLMEGAGPGKALQVWASGSKQGEWCDFRVGKGPGAGGGPMALIFHTRAKGNARDARALARGWLGLDHVDEADRQRYFEEQRARQKVAAAREREKDEARQATSIRRFQEASLLKGSPGAVYFSRHRHICFERIGHWPRALRYHPNLWCAEINQHLPAVVAAVTGLKDQTTLHRIWLDPLTFDKNRNVNSRTIYGKPNGGSVKISRGQSGLAFADMLPDEELVIAEGIETALAAAMLWPERRIIAAITLPFMRSVALPVQCQKVALLLENDSNAQAREQADNVVAAHRQAGRAVRVVRSPVGSDWNDYVMAGGAHG